MMKNTLIIAFTAFFFGMAWAQNPTGTVHDPINNSQLVSMGATLATLQQQSKEVVKTLETGNQIRSAAKVWELIKAIENSYCIIQDLDFYNSRAKALFKTKSNCFDSFLYSVCRTAIENAMSMTTMALQSPSMSLGERSATVTKAFDTVKDSNEDLNTMKEGLRKKVEGREKMEKSMSQLNKIF